MLRLRLLILLWILASLLLSIPITKGQNQPYTFRQITVDDGLPQSSISAIFQDLEGFMWLCTEDGLVRYDGYEFKVFRQKPGINTSIGGNFVNSIAEDEEGFLWLSLGYSGINIFNKTSEQFSSPIQPDSLPKEITACFNLLILGIEGKLIWMSCEDTKTYYAFDKLNKVFYSQKPSSDTESLPISTSPLGDFLQLGNEIRFTLPPPKNNELKKRLIQSYPDFSLIKEYPHKSN